MRLLRFAYSAVILPLGCACAIAAVLALGGRFSDHLDVLTHFAPLYVAGGLLVAVASLGVARRRLPMTLAIAAILPSAVLMAPEFLRPQSPYAPADAPGQIKLVQFNAALDAQGLDARIAWLAQVDPDILVVEDSREVFQTAVAQRLDRSMSCGRTCGVAIFTRKPPETIESPRRGRYGLGPAIAVAHLADAKGRFPVIGVHYTWPTSVRTHRENSIRLQQILKPMAKDRMIVTGDFNSTPWSFGRRRDDKAIGVERRTRALPTWPANGPFGLAFLPIDHVYAGPGWRTVSIERGPRLGSDHYPVIAVLAPR